MNIFIDLVSALLAALILTWLFYILSGGRKSKRLGLLWVFLILVLAAWSGGVWMKPIGPAWYGIHWLGFLMVGLIVCLILIIANPGRPPRGREDTLELLESIKEEREIEKATYLTVSIFFWVLLLLLILMILLRYLI